MAEFDDFWDAMATAAAMADDDACEDDDAFWAAMSAAVEFAVDDED